MRPARPRASGRHDRRFTTGTLIVLAILYILFIDRFSVDVGGERYFCLSDDQMISMRYAANLAAGHGLVWNPGERVEGFTNPLWTAYMATWHVAGIPASKTSLAIMATSAVLLLLNAVAIGALASRLSPSTAVARLSMILAGTYWPLVQWSLEGFEVGLTAVLTTFVVVEALAYLDSRGTRRLVAIAVGLSALGWTRLEMLPIVGLPTGTLLLLDADRRRFVRFVLLPVAAGMAALIAVRWWYFGEWLPNTYYLKLTGVPLADRLSMGLSKGASTLLTHFSIVFTPVVLTLDGVRRNRRFWVLLAIFVLAFIYTVAIGGDTWERPYYANRFLSAITPLVITVALGLAYEHVRRIRDASTAAAVATALAALMAIGLSGRAFVSWLQTDVKKSGNFGMMALGLEMKEKLPPDAKVAVVWAGALPYFSGLPAVDLLGKTDKVIARTAPRGVVPGHNKWDYEYSIGVLQPDYIVELWEPTPSDLAYVKQLGYAQMGNGVYFRRQVSVTE